LPLHHVAGQGRAVAPAWSIELLSKQIDRMKRCAIVQAHAACHSQASCSRNLQGRYREVLYHLCYPEKYLFQTVRKCIEPCISIAGFSCLLDVYICLKLSTVLPFHQPSLQSQIRRESRSDLLMVMAPTLPGIGLRLAGVQQKNRSTKVDSTLYKFLPIEPLLLERQLLDTAYELNTSNNLS
jgi:hypothetical protein